MIFYKIVAYAPGKDAVTWAKNNIELMVKIDELVGDKYADIRIKVLERGRI